MSVKKGEFPWKKYARTATKNIKLQSGSVGHVPTGAEWLFHEKKGHRKKKIKRQSQSRADNYSHYIECENEEIVKMALVYLVKQV